MQIRPNPHPPTFHTLVIGAGLIGAAAARHLSARVADVAVVGPDEPADWQHHDGVFASHYDSGRITRRLSRDRLWARLAADAVGGYRALEQAGGVPFYNPVGCLTAAPHDADYLAAVTAVGDELGVAYERYASAAALAAAHPGVVVSAECAGVFEPAPAGIIDPRALIRAQLTVAQRQGATLIRATARAVQPDAAGVRVTTDDGAVLRAERVLVAAGAFSNGYGLLAQPLALRVKSETIVLARVSEAEAARLRALPAVLYEIDSPVLDEIYCLPPLRYPDGAFYIKMGCNTVADRTLPDVAAMRAWMMHGDSDGMLPALRAALAALLPGVAVEQWRSGRCLVTYTPHGYPFIDQLGERLFVATGGNGHAAKCSDTLGRLAARRVLGEWEAGFSQEAFQARLAAG